MKRTTYLTAACLLGGLMVATILSGLQGPAQAADVAAPSANPLDVVINEVGWMGTQASASDEWIELYNPGPTTVDLSSVYLSDDRNNLLQYKIPDGVVLQPGEFWAIREGTPPNGFSFGLDFSGETIYVTAATDDPVPEPIRVLDAVRYGAMEPDVTFG